METNLINNPLITVVTVVYNDVKHIEETILSVINQTYPNIEYIIIDGGSTDGTVDIIKKYADHIAYWVSEPDKGIYDAMNKGLARATGEWVNFMNSGDLYVSSEIIKSIFTARDYAQYGIVWGYVKMAISNKVFRYIPFFENKNKLSPMGICHQSIFVKRLLALELGFDESYQIAADYNMINSLYQDGYPFFEFKEAISIYRIDEYSYSRNHIFKQLREEAKICNVSVWSFSYAVKFMRVLLISLYRFIYK